MGEPKDQPKSGPDKNLSAAGLSAEMAREETAGERELFQKEFERIVADIVNPHAVDSEMLRSAATLMLSRGSNEALFAEMQMVARDIAGRAFDEILRKVEAKKKIQRGTAGELLECSEEVEEMKRKAKELFQAQGEIAKMKNRPYGGDRAAKDAMDTEELHWFNDWITRMRSVDPKEFAAMVTEDHDFLTMMVEEGRTDEPSSPDDLLALNNPDYQKNMDRLVNFVLGFDKDKAGTAPKSRFRKGSEAVIWQEIVRNLDTQKQADLINKIIQKAGAEKARLKIAGFIIAGSMTRADAQELFDAGKIPGIDAGMNPKEYKDFNDFLRVTAAAKERVTADMADFTNQMENPQIQNAIAYFFTFNKLGAETIGRIGALTALFNGVFSVVDRFKTHPHDESWYTSLAVGLKNAVTNEYVLGGVATAMVASEVVYPWMKEAVYSPGADEREKLGRITEMRFLQEQADNHREAMDHFVANYDDLYAMADSRNGQEQEFDKPDGKGKEKLTREKLLYPGDLTGLDADERFRITPRLAGEWGYEATEGGARLAEAKIIKMFNICQTTLKGKDLSSQIKLQEFLAETVFLKKPAR